MEREAGNISNHENMMVNHGNMMGNHGKVMDNHGDHVLIDDALWKTDILHTLLNMQKNGELCDVTIETNDGAVLSAHACVLAASSALLSTLLRQSQSSPPRQLRVTSDISADVWHKVITYMYTGELILPQLQQGLYDVVMAARSLQMQNLLRACDEGKHVVQSRRDQVTELFSNVESMVGLHDCDETPRSQSDETPRSQLYQRKDINEETSDAVDHTEAVQSADVPQPTVGIEKHQSVHQNGDNTIGDSDTQFAETCPLSTISQLPSSPKDSSHTHSLPGSQVRQCTHTNEVTHAFPISTEQFMDDQNVTTEKSNEHSQLAQNSVIFPVEHREVELGGEDGGEQSVASQNAASFQEGDLNTIQGIHDNSATVVNLLEVSDARQIYEYLNTQHINVPTQSVVEVTEITFPVVGSLNGGSVLQYRCSACAMVVTDIQEHLDLHRRSHLRLFECPHCKNRYKTRSYLRRHLAFSHPSGNSRAVCPICSKTFLTTYHLKRHMSLTCNDRRPWQCPYCSKQTRTRRDLDLHITLHTGYKPHICGVCYRGFATRNRLKAHMSVHETGEYKCHCGKVFNSEKNYKYHYNYTHSTSNPYRCQICHKSGRSAIWLQKHMVCHTKKYLCRECKKGFDTKQGCALHEKLHLITDKSVLECPKCQKVLKTRRNLQRHLADVHGEDFEFKCDRCKKSFETQQLLNEHKLEHTRAKKLTCKRCNAELLGEDTLRDHLKSVHGISENSFSPKVFMCAMCKQFFRNETDFYVHESSHETPIKCMFCKISFDLVANLRTHICAKLRCVYCEVNFKTPTLLEAHVRLHSQGKIVLTCDHCSDQFVTLSHKQDHVDKCHGNISTGT